MGLVLAAAAHRKYHFHILECAICSASASCHGGNVQSSLKDNYRMSETLFFPGWEVETSAKTSKWSSLSVKHWRRFVEWLSELPLTCETTQSKISNIHLAFPISIWGCSFVSLTHVLFGSLLLPSVTFLLKINQNLHYIIRAVKRFLNPFLLFSTSHSFTQNQTRHTLSSFLTIVLAKIKA